MFWLICNTFASDWSNFESCSGKRSMYNHSRDTFQLFKNFTNLPKEILLCRGMHCAQMNQFDVCSTMLTEQK